METYAASVALVREDYVLLIQRAQMPAMGQWTLPGGRLEPGETAEAAARRELFEETGFTAPVLRPVRRIPIGGPANYALDVFVANDFTGFPNFSNEVAAHRWVRPADLRGLNTTEGLAPILAEAFAVLAAS